MTTIDDRRCENSQRNEDGPMTTFTSVANTTERLVSAGGTMSDMTALLVAVMAFAVAAAARLADRTETHSPESKTASSDVAQSSGFGMPLGRGARRTMTARHHAAVEAPDRDRRALVLAGGGIIGMLYVCIHPGLLCDVLLHGSADQGRVGRAATRASHSISSWPSCSFPSCW